MTKIETLYKEAKGDKTYYSFESFAESAKSLLKDIKRGTVYCSIKPSASGMSRRINFENHYNGVLNVVYNKKVSFDPVYISGCGMDMLWYLLFNFCEAVASKKVIESQNLNSRCSHCTYVL